MHTVSFHLQMISKVEVQVRSVGQDEERKTP
jgi:hypothetical protein